MHRAPSRSLGLSLALLLSAGCTLAPATPTGGSKPVRQVLGPRGAAPSTGLGGENLSSIIAKGRPVVDATGKPTGEVVRSDGTVVDATGKPTGATLAADGNSIVAADGTKTGVVGEGTVVVPGQPAGDAGASGTEGGGSSPVASAPPGTVASAPPVVASTRPPAVVNPIALESLRRGPEATWANVAISGQVKLISDHGGGIISNNTGNLIGNNSGGLIGNNSGGLIGNNSGGYRLAQATNSESPLADAKVEFLDAEGQLLVGSDGGVLSATTDALGNYNYQGPLPKEAVVARVRLWQGGQLQSMVAKDAPSNLPLNTATSLGAAYVVQEYVNSRPVGQRGATYDRLPASNAQALQQAMEAARGVLSATSLTYQPAATGVLAAQLKASNGNVDTQLEAIKAILLAGQANLGNGQLATQVSLSGPVSVVAGASGKRYVAELVGGRVREIAADGTIKALDLAWPSSPPLTMEALWWLPATEELLVVDRLANRVWKAKPSTGQVSVFAGTGTSGTAGLPGPAASAQLNQPFAITGKADGSLVLAENRTGTARGRLLQISAAGQMSEIQPPPSLSAEGKLLWSGVAYLSDGALAAYEENQGKLWWLNAGQWTQQSLPGLASAGERASLLGAGNQLYLAAMGRHKLVRFGRNEAPVLLAGTGQAAYGGDGGPGTQAQINSPRGMSMVDANTLWLTDSGNGLVRSLALGGANTISRVAGVAGSGSQGDANNLPVQTPGGITVDALGQVVYSEGSTGLLKRLSLGQISNLGGTTLGFGGDGGPALQAQFKAPAGLATGLDGTLYVCDADNQALRAISPAGIVDTVMGRATQRGVTETLTVAAKSLMLKRPTACAVAPNGDVYLTDSEVNQVWRLRAGQATRVAGRADGTRGDSGDGGLAVNAALTLPMGVAVGADGSVYISDTGNSRVRRVTPDGQISTFAGVAGTTLLQRLVLGPTTDADGTLATQALLVAPAGLAISGDGRLFIAEAGSTFINSQLATMGAPPLNGNIASRVRAVGSDGRLVNVAGAGGKVLNEASGDNSLTGALAIAVDTQGRLLIADTLRNQLKLVPAGAF